MKRCVTCGVSHPDDVTTSHHPVPCFPNCFCQQKGNAPEGCIWSRTITFPAEMPQTQRRRHALLSQADMAIERDTAIREAATGLIPPDSRSE